MKSVCGESQPGTLLPPGDVWQYLELLSCHNWEDAPGAQGVEARDAAKDPTGLIGHKVSMMLRLRHPALENAPTPTLSEGRKRRSQSNHRLSRKQSASPRGLSGGECSPKEGGSLNVVGSVLVEAFVLVSATSILIYTEKINGKEFLLLP